ncbi:MAG: chromate transporter, partial [Caulobacteraceae bacterium]
MGAAGSGPGERRPGLEAAAVKPIGDTLTALAVQFAILSLLAFGGANAVVPEIQRPSVQVHHWTSDKDFATLFDIA